jgi:ABC-type glycerol-3-phosphate transport system substrate-binding protein
MDHRLRHLAEQLDAGLIARREFLRKAAVITGGTAAGLGVLGKMAHAQSGTKMRVWLFKSFVTASNDILAKQVEAWGAERKVQVDMDWATFGDREQKFVAAIEAGNPPDIGRDELPRAHPVQVALRDVSKLAKDIASARGGLLPFAERATNVGGQFYGVARLTFPGGFFVRKDMLDAKGVKMPKTYDPDVVEMAKKCQDPSKDIWGFGQTLNRSDDGNGFMNNILLDYGGGVWDKDGKPALGTSFLKQNLAALQFAVDTIQKYKIQPPGVMSWTDVHNNEAFIAGKLVSTNNGASLYYGLVSKKNPIAEKTLVIQTPGGPAGSFVLAGAYSMGIFKQTKNAELSEDLIRWIEDEKRFDEFRNASIGQAGPVYKARAESPYWKSDPNFEGMMQNVLRGVWIGYPGPVTAAAVEVQAQYILCDMAGRVVVGGLSPEAALKEAHARVEEIYKIRSRA